MNGGYALPPPRRWSALALTGCGSMAANQLNDRRRAKACGVQYVSTHPHDRNSRGHEPRRPRRSSGMDRLTPRVVATQPDSPLLTWSSDRFRTARDHPM
jgi:hypothetical protein